MKSVLAVVVQMALSGSNYAVFLIMARVLDETAFVGFSTAVGLNMLAYALAEGGVSYVAPKALATRTDGTEARLAGSFIAISSTLYIAAMVVGFGAWNGLATDSLQLPWVAAYAIYFAPALLIPAWIICWSVDKAAVVAVLVVRTAIVLAIALHPSVSTLCASGVTFSLLVAWLLVRGNRSREVVIWPDRPSLISAISDLRQVFMARTGSYAAYAALPLLVGIFRGNDAASFYVTAERLKSLYATLFQPIIQSLYLWQFQGAASTRHKALASVTIHILNVCACLLALFAAYQGWFDILGSRFTAVAHSPIIWLASGISVASACLLLLHVFPSGNFILFRRAAWIQLLGFAAAGGWLLVNPDQASTWLLLGGEMALFLAIVIQLMRRSASPPSATSA